ncbi:hypothetical protein RB597_001356 [Gaeumannomyces tritici]
MSGCALPTFISMQAQIRHMLPLGEGRIVNAASASPPNILDEGGADASARYAVSNPELFFFFFSPSRWFQAADVSDGILINTVVPACLSQRFMQEALSPGWLRTGTAFAGGKPFDEAGRGPGLCPVCRVSARMPECVGQIVTVDGGQ